ncbi:putative fatty acyl-CoA reductase CG8306 [Schistocerca americana]|uniref:putative fatty acyl-CoA reductase CG8306 n=1 Tax=Schistocerca americana TaxID=7009 RepID=UPI001F4F21F1|nr:putative fatty acyl-CoA reductase CG8306 [Schistocerca americana]XP_046980088.1 putative fatty acyl-CoA reductase CG8306 [Schistocerca americana]XP_046980089.1 putative fatty acyl-CoA reductase CG8306 [Schistocerca americana]
MAGEGSNSPILDFLRGKKIFLTGGTGFVGVALIEKLLRTTEVDTIYLLMRPKKGKQIAERLQELEKNSGFECLVKECPEKPFARLKAVAGDVSEEGLGLLPEDRQMLAREVQLVFHSAATLDFESPLKPTVATNLLGTRRVIELCREMSKLEAMVHVSSAYVNSDKKKVEEILYDPPADVEKVINIATTLNDEAVDAMTPKLLGELPNAYALTKNLAEHEVSKAVQYFPVAIVRPSMITAAWKEPVPGWTISKNGPTGFMMGAAKGVVRRLPMKTDVVCDYIPVDCVVNELIAAIWEAATTRPNKVLVYHCTSSTHNPFRWAKIENHVNTYLHKYPLNSAVWYPHLKFLPSLLLFRISAIFVHFAPAYVLDTVMRVAGGRPILVRLHTNVSRSLSRLEPFIFSEWFFDNKNTLALQKKLSEKDADLFNVDVGSLQWENYFIDLAQGVRQYLNNEPPKTLPAARRKDTILLVAHLSLQAVLYGLLWWAVSSALNASFAGTGWAVIIAYILFSFL